MMINQIQENDAALTTLELVKDPKEYFENVKDFLDAVQQNNVITSICMDHDFLEGLDDQDICEEFLEQVGKAPSLQKLQLRNAFIDAKPLAVLIEMATKLDTLELKNIELSGGPQEFTDLQYSVYRHDTLEVFSMKDIKAYEWEYKVQDFIKALGHSHSLRVFELHSTKQQEFLIPATALLRLRSARNLKELRITGYPLEARAFQMLAFMLKTSQLMLLALRNTNLGEEEKKRLSASIKQDQYLYLEDNDNKPDIVSKQNPAGSNNKETRRHSQKALAA